jgi:hypothetical protein
MKLEIQKTLVISTGHITKEDDRLLHVHCNTPNGNLPLIVDEDIHGWKVHTDILETNLEDMRGQFSIDFLNCLMLAYLNDCQWINFDGDGPIYETLQIHEW